MIIIIIITESNSGGDGKGVDLTYLVEGGECDCSSSRSPLEMIVCVRKEAIQIGLLLCISLLIFDVPVVNVVVVMGSTLARLFKPRTRSRSTFLYHTTTFSELSVSFSLSNSYRPTTSRFARSFINVTFSLYT